MTDIINLESWSMDLMEHPNTILVHPVILFYIENQYISNDEGACINTLTYTTKWNEFYKNHKHTLSKTFGYYNNYYDSCDKSWKLYIDYIKFRKYLKQLNKVLKDKTVKFILGY